MSLEVLAASSVSALEREDFVEDMQVVDYAVKLMFLSIAN